MLFLELKASSSTSFYSSSSIPFLSDFVSSIFPSSIIFSSSLSSYASISPTYVFSVSSSSVLVSLSPRLEVVVSPGVIFWVLINVSLSMSIKLDHSTGILSLLRASSTIILIKP